MPSRSVLLSALLALTLLTGCPQSGAAGGAGSSSGTATASTDPTPADHEQAKEVFSGRCAVCHGPKGAGDGAASAGLDPKPANFTDPSWQDSVTDEHIEKIVKYGGSAVGKSAAMPGNPDLASKDALITAIRLHIRSLKSK